MFAYFLLNRSAKYGLTPDVVFDLLLREQDPHYIIIYLQPLMVDRLEVRRDRFFSS